MVVTCACYVAADTQASCEVRSRVRVRRRSGAEVAGSDVELCCHDDVDGKSQNDADAIRSMVGIPRL